MTSHSLALIPAVHMAYTVWNARPVRPCLALLLAISSSHFRPARSPYMSEVVHIVFDNWRNCNLRMVRSARHVLCFGIRRMTLSR